MDKYHIVIAVLFVTGSGIIGGFVGHQHQQIDSLQNEVETAEIENKELQKDVTHLENENSELRERSHTYEPNVSVSDCHKTGYDLDNYECDISVVYPFYTYETEGVGHNVYADDQYGTVTIYESEDGVIAVKTPFITQYYELTIIEYGNKTVGKLNKYNPE